MELASTTMGHTHVIVQGGGKIRTAKKVITKRYSLVYHNSASNLYHILWCVNRKHISRIMIEEMLLMVIYFLDLDECTVYEPCQNNGTCTNNKGSYFCTCAEGWQGKDCEEGIHFD